MENTKKAYSSILKLVRKHKDLVLFNLDDLERTAKLHLFGLELKEVYGLNVYPKDITSTEWQQFGRHKAICLMDGERRTILWPDDGRQPKNEILLQISFPTGAYIFGDDYPTDLFQSFWMELKGYEPKYCDTANHNLYFDLPNAKNIFNSFEEILNKYKELNKADALKRQIKKAEKELELLKQRE